MVHFGIAIGKPTKKVMKFHTYVMMNIALKITKPKLHAQRMTGRLLQDAFLTVSSIYVLL